MGRRCCEHPGPWPQPVARWSMADRISLYHTCPARYLGSILTNGILPALARGARREVWLHSPARMAWAREHVAERHGCPKVVSLRVSVPRDWLTRRRRGVWTCPRVIPPGEIQAINVGALVGCPAA